AARLSPSQPSRARKGTSELITQANNAIRVPLGRMQAEADVPMSGRNERNALADERRDHVDVELVDLVRVEERGDEAPTPHDPDMLSGGRSEATRKCPHRFRHELD